MTWTSVALIGLLCAFTIAYLLVVSVLTRHIVNSTMFDRQQKALQLALIWLIPILGPALTLAVVLPDIRTRHERVSILDYLLLSASLASTEEADTVNQHTASGHPLHGGDGPADTAHSLDNSSW